MRAGLEAGTKTGASVFAILGAALALVFEPSLYIFGSAAIPSVLVGFGRAWSKGKGTDIPPLILDELSVEQNYTCQPCTPANLRAATDMVSMLFGRDSIEVEVLEQWRLKNPQGFMEIIDSVGDLIACFVIIGLSNSFMSQFAAGRLTEKDIAGEDVLDMRSTKKQPEIYISGIMVKDPGGITGSVRAHYLIWSMLMYLKHHFGLKSVRRFYAVPLTNESEQLLKHLGFSVASSAKTRKDKHNFYFLDVDIDKWNKLLHRVGDYRAGCKIKYKR